jgi:uncharacterized protein (TIGR00369 family)
MSDSERLVLERVEATFNRQRVMETFGVKLLKAEAGLVELGFSHAQALTQQHGFLHAGVLTSVVDSACGFAALSVMPPDAGVLSIEFKMNLLSPARYQRYRAVGRVVKAGRTVVVCQGEIVTNDETQPPVTVAIMTASMMVVQPRAGEPAP